MVYSIIFLLALILAPLWGQLRGYKPAALFFVVATVYAIFAAISLAQIQIVLRQMRNADPAYHDTYYVVSHDHSLVNIGILMVVLGAITWGQTRFGAMRYSALTKALFWALHISLIGNIAIQALLAFSLPTSPRFIDPPTYIKAVVLIGSLWPAALFGLFCLLLWSILVKWRAK